MNILSVVISSLGLLYICNAENSRLLLQNFCICQQPYAPVCCDGNIEFEHQCAADCASATNCLPGACDALADAACQLAPCRAGTQCELKQGVNAKPGEVECAMIPDYCTSDSDCEVKNVGNCCGYYPGCVNTNYTPDLEAVAKECEDNGMVSICGWQQPSGCTCQNQRCVEDYTPITPTTTATNNNCDTLPEGYTLVGTPDTCRRIKYSCPPRYIHWGDKCGCGCKPDCLSLPADYRILAKPDQCDNVEFACKIGEEYFRNDCGCGCRQMVNPCAFTTCLTGNKCVDNGDGSASCVPLTKKICKIGRKKNQCDPGYECARERVCDGNVIGRRRQRRKRKKGVCLKKGGSCGGFVGAQCQYKGEECSYPCGSSLGECITYQYI